MIIKKLSNIKIQLALFLTLFAFYIAFISKSGALLKNIAIAVICALATECLLTYIKERTRVISSSAVITGLIIGLVISSSGQAAWITPLAVLVAIGSKYLLRLKGRHIFNPAGLGILFMILLFNSSTDWSGTYYWYILGPAGLYFSYKIRKLEVILSYFIVSLLLFGAQALAQKIYLSAVFGYFSYFFIFIMLIEPKTSPVSKIGKIIFGAGTAALIFTFTQAGIRFDAELTSLLVMNLTVPFLNQIKERSKP